ncbi:hypothetical protein EVG20_g1522 [Dentipellis fragilis]|uniref:Uncharacterized protein n=1 Tax=Dentipellis fragilis TaxID=205917 RepID=A0A4Y9ZCD9_9AGAM|nr:hypothetical protein EVG20_g1522 [Dentipellis fragilis]
MSSDLVQLLGQSPSSGELQKHLNSLTLNQGSPDIAGPEVKSYPDAVYFNFYRLGLSLLFAPINGYKPSTGASRADLQDSNLKLDGIDIYNASQPKDPAKQPGRSLANPAYSAYPTTPLVIPLTPKTKDGKDRSTELQVTSETTGKDFVTALGEPDRKGGGSGPSSGSIGIWLEWSRDGLMIEFGGDESRGPQAWEKGKDAVWSVISIFSPKA